MKQVLYVEDSATSQLLMRKYLQSACELTITPSPRAGVALAHERAFDLIITDYLFPEGDALDLITQVRQTKDPRQLPIVVVSSSMDPALQNRVLKAGANDGMSKPLPTQEFRAMVEQMLTEPYVRTPEKSVSSIPCFQWLIGGQHHEFCPELGLQFSGQDRQEVSRRMTAALREKITGGTTLGFVTHEKVITHVVQS